MDRWTSSTVRPLSLEGARIWGRLLDVHDGDTITVAAEVFGGHVFQFHVRLSGIDTPEMTSNDDEVRRRAEVARHRVVQLLAPEIADDVRSSQHLTRGQMQALIQRRVHPVFLRCSTFDKYGRVLAEVAVREDAPHVALALLQEGLAQPYDGRTKRQWAMGGGTQSTQGA